MRTFVNARTHADPIDEGVGEGVGEGAGEGVYGVPPRRRVARHLSPR
jgi:hypothetical protein